MVVLGQVSSITGIFIAKPLQADKMKSKNKATRRQICSSRIASNRTI
jgi:hypothetical protein